MAEQTTISPDAIRTLFSRAMSDMYRVEVPQYGLLTELVATVNQETCAQDPVLARRLQQGGEAARLDVERHGAIRVGAPEELGWLRRLFAVMGMYPVGYYDLSVAGVPVHSTAFRPIDDTALKLNPLRIFTSLLRLDLIADPALREEAAEILARRKIFTADCLVLIESAERQGGLTEAEAEHFVREAVETFRWHSSATVSAETYARLRKSHPLVADVVCFRGPHINHLTPRTLDIDAVQARMPDCGMTPKAVIEGPPARRVPILLRQTSFKAIEEPVAFVGEGGAQVEGAHTARFGEVEQRGVALTRKGRELYDRLLNQAREQAAATVPGDSRHYADILASIFEAFPDDATELRVQGLAYFRYTATGRAGAPIGGDLVAQGFLAAEPITYEDFLPVSAAGIFQSNLGHEEQATFAQNANQLSFEAALGVAVADETMLYEEAQSRSIEAALSALNGTPAST